MGSKDKEKEEWEVKMRRSIVKVISPHRKWEAV